MGRVANRIANATFTLNGTQYQLGANDRWACILLLEVRQVNCQSLPQCG